MKALLFESEKENRQAIVLLPSGAIEMEAGEPANFIIEKDGLGYSIRLLMAHDLAVLKMVRECEVSGSFFARALQFRVVRIAYERTKVEFKDLLLNEMITPNCDALTFLDFGSAVL